MSYDILIFDPAHAPSEREAFLEWWDRRDHWSEPHPRNDPAFTTPKLRAWFFDMIERFPALNGPYAVSRNQRSADYCIGYHVIYVAIWFDKQATHERAFELAGKHTLGFFEASSPGGEIWLPGNGTELVLSSKHQEKPPKPITDPRIAALVRSYRPGGAVVYLPAYAENPRRRVVVVYISRDLIGLDPPLPRRGNLAQLESALTQAGIVYAVVEEDQHRAFASDLHEAFRFVRRTP